MNSKEVAYLIVNISRILLIMKYISNNPQFNPD